MHSRSTGNLVSNTTSTACGLSMWHLVSEDPRACCDAALPSVSLRSRPRREPNENSEGVGCGGRGDKVWHLEERPSCTRSVMADAMHLDSPGVGLARERVGSKRQLDVPVAATHCVQCHIPFSGPQAVGRARFSCGCVDFCGSCAGASFLDCMPSKASPEFAGFSCRACQVHVQHYMIGHRKVMLDCGYEVFAPPWQVAYHLADLDDRQDSISMSLSAVAKDGTVTVLGGTFSTGTEDAEPEGVLRADLVRICMYIGAIIGVGQETVATPRCDSMNQYARAAIDDTGVFHQCMRALILCACVFNGDNISEEDVDGVDAGSESARDVFDATPCMPTIKELGADTASRHETCGVWTIVNIARKLRNPRMVTGAAGFLARAVCSHDSVLSLSK
jgi:hypothetical protein